MSSSNLKGLGHPPWVLAGKLGIVTYSNTNAAGEVIGVGPTVPPKINGA